VKPEIIIATTLLAANSKQYRLSFHFPKNDLERTTGNTPFVVLVFFQHQSSLPPYSG
jgi:hypothetical protein